jgi:hypothetical protein
MNLGLWGVDMNLLEETIKTLRDNGKTIFDIEWFGTTDCEYNCDLQELINIDYDDGYGVSEVPSDFILVGKDFWLERHEYDGSEWWEYKSIPEKPSEIKQVARLIEFR